MGEFLYIEKWKGGVTHYTLSHCHSQRDTSTYPTWEHAWNDSFQTLYQKGNREKATSSKVTQRFNSFMTAILHVDCTLSSLPHFAATELSG
mmetsp:Transcript_29954/g.77321  ORF Transcript_29954/g.77321 Transcript_29954/m.77321 type:complete len:91 (-) Transcript_29954:350-622(-)